MDIPVKGLSTQIAAAILKGFNRHFTIFSKITKGAKERFENADWEAERSASRGLRASASSSTIFASRMRFAICRNCSTWNPSTANSGLTPALVDQAGFAGQRIQPAVRKHRARRALH
jgi:hypothetical protein